MAEINYAVTQSHMRQPGATLTVSLNHYAVLDFLSTPANRVIELANEEFDIDEASSSEKPIKRYDFGVIDHGIKYDVSYNQQNVEFLNPKFKILRNYDDTLQKKMQIPEIPLQNPIHSEVVV